VGYELHIEKIGKFIAAKPPSPVVVHIAAVINYP
jgi:hypothetical protein